MSIYSSLKRLFLAVSIFSITLPTFADEQHKISGVDAKVYYQKFIYGERAVVNSTNKHWGYLTNDRLIYLEDGKRASTALFLLKDGTYILRYTEGTSSGQGSFTFDSSKDIIDIKGNWRVVGSNLELDGFATATGVQIGTRDMNGKPITVDGVAFTNLKNIRAPGLAGKVILMVSTISTHPM